MDDFKGRVQQKVHLGGTRIFQELYIRRNSKLKLCFLNCFKENLMKLHNIIYK